MRVVLFMLFILEVVLFMSFLYLMFEVENLNNASPATVSRAGIVYVSETDLDWEPVVEAWLKTRAEAHIPILRELFD